MSSNSSHVNVFSLKPILSYEVLIPHLSYGLIVTLLFFFKDDLGIK